MTEVLERSVQVKCTVQHAFRVFTQMIDVWWPRSHRRNADARICLEGGVGGRFFEAREGDDDVRLGEVLAWEPPSRLTYTWYPGAIEKPTRVDIRFSPQGDATLVEVTHTEGESELGEVWPARAKKFAWAWSEVLPAFANYALNNSSKTS